ncbi:MAG: DEAD/DEAH box helicase [Thermofilum sp.]|nr:DEAD/DEAH box helicase [Thermofilum sp.]
MSEDEIRAYHLIITDLEAPRIAKEGSIKEGSWYPIKNVEYFITYEELEDFLRRRNFKNPNNIITSLINKGFLVQLPRSDSKSDYPLLRSLHMDVLVRSSQITTMHGNPPYLLSYKFAITKFKVPVKEDRAIIPGRNNPLWNKLYDAIQSFFNNNRKLVDIYVNTLKEYLLRRDTGLDDFQSYVLCRMLSSDKNVYAIVAPTGSGKTEIYLFYLLAVIMRWRLLEGDNSKKVLLVYPRKALTIDQACRIIELLSIANNILEDKYKYKITFGIRDGDTPRDVKRGEAFRGVACPYCKEQLIYDSADSVACKGKGCARKFNFVKTVRKTVAHADIIATNPWALETRLLDSAIEDVGAKTLRDAALVVFDEAHEYTGVSGGILASLIDVSREINEQKDVKLIFSSATIPNPDDFIAKLSGDNNYGILDFESAVTQRRLQIKGERLVILAHFMMNPQYSWNTYCQLWSVFMAFLSYAYKLRKVQQPQSILFINNIRELRRVKSGYIENLRIGEPKDHLADSLDPLDPYCYWHYLPTNLVSQIRNWALGGGLVDELKDLLLEIHSEVPRETRERAAARLRSGEGAVVLSTSSLELGVDYDGVGFVLNAGLDNPISLVQRIGRGGRNDRTIRCVLGIILARALPTEMLKTYDENFMKAIATMSISGYKLFVTKDNPQIVKRRILIESIAKLAVEGKDTYESGGSKGPIRNLETLRSFIQDIIGKISEDHD